MISPGLASPVRRLVPWFLLALLGGCGNWLRVTTMPPGSLVVIKDAAGRPVASGTDPVKAMVKFSDKNIHYVIEAIPSGADTDSYVATTRQVTEDAYNLLQAVTDRTRHLRLELGERRYVNLVHIEVVPKPSGEWLGIITSARAFKDITETQGAAPSMIVDFEENLGIEGFAISPGGQQIVYSVARYTRQLGRLEDAYGSAEDRILSIRESNLRGVNIQGGGIQQITSEQFRDMYPFFTPDGQYLLFSSNRRRANAADILRMGTSGRGGIANIYVDTRGATTFMPSQSTYGTIVFALYPKDSRPEDVQIWTLGGANTFPTQIGLGQQPRIAPYGDRIAYIGRDNNLWVMGVDGSNETQLTFDADGIAKRFIEDLNEKERKDLEQFKAENIRPFFPFRAPSWSPDGEYILYTSMEGTDPNDRPNEDIWIMRYDGSDKRQLTTNGSADRFPLMSPDMRWIYFLSNRGGRWAIWRIQAPAFAGEFKEGPQVP